MSTLGGSEDVHMFSSALASQHVEVGMERECLDAEMGMGGAEAHQHPALSPSCVFESLCVSLSDYLLLSLRAAVCISQKGQRTRSFLRRQHEKDQLGRASSFDGPMPFALLPTESPSLGLTRLHPHCLTSSLLRFTSQLSHFCNTKGIRECIAGQRSSFCKAKPVLVWSA